jgi:hypothetical protein
MSVVKTEITRKTIVRDRFEILIWAYLAKYRYQWISLIAVPRLLRYID